MRMIAILTDKNHKRIVRHVIHAISGEVDFYEPDELSDIELHRQYDCLVSAATLEDIDGAVIIHNLQGMLPSLKPSRIALIDNGDIDGIDAGFSLLPEYHLDHALERWLQSFSTSTAAEGSKCLLYISDDRLMHAIVKDLFKGEGTRLIHAYDGQSGYQLYKEQHPDLILTDLDLPLLDGFSLLERIKLIDGDQKIQILLFSSTSDEATILKAYSLKAKGYLVKPMAPGELKHKVEKYLHPHH